MKTVPKNLRMIAGNSKAPGPQDTSIVYWGCSEDAGIKSNMPVNCSSHAGSTVLAHIIFPSCWDGKKLDSTDHKSHMAYPTLDDGCPNDHPVAIPTITMSIKWPFVNGKDITLSSGAAYTLHGDFWNAWVQPDQESAREGIFGPAIPVPDDAPILDRVVGLTGRDPAWSPG